MINKEDILNFLRQEWGNVNFPFTYKSYELYNLDSGKKEKPKKEDLDNLNIIALEDSETLPCYLAYFKNNTQGLYGGFLVKDGNICPKSKEQYDNILKGVYD
mgnify:FL=1